MLIVLPSTPGTEKASHWLTEQGIEHQIVPIPESLGYKTGSDTGLYIQKGQVDIAMLLTRAHFVVMRVFKDFELSP